MRSLHLVCGAALLAAGFVPLHAQGDEQPEQAIERARQVMVRLGGALAGENPERAALGITTASSSRRDTLGLLIESITPGGPADKAGLQEGNRIAAVNGINLRLAAADAGQRDMQGLMTRRLVRELGKVKPGDEVKLEVWADGQFRTVSIKTVKLGDLEGGGWMTMGSANDENRAVIGLGWGGEASPRDTLGLLVVQVTDGGPADKAGIQEGDRIQAINGTDVRVPSADASGRGGAASAERRFRDAMAKVKAGDAVELKVYSDGGVKTVKVTTARAGDVYKGMDRNLIRFRTNDGAGWGDGMYRMRMPPVPPVPPVWNLEPDGPRALEMRDMELPRLRARSLALRAEGEAMRRSAIAMRDRARAMTVLIDRDGESPEGAAFAGRGMGGGFALRDLRLAPVNGDLASYFGAGSERGLLVLHAGGRWSQLRAGDVILAVNGKPVREGSRTSISLDTDQQTKFDVLRKGKRVSVVAK